MARRGKDEARLALGVPVPPVWLARAANRLRNRLGYLHGAMVPGFALVLERLLWLVDNKALFCAVDLGVPDLLAERPRHAAEIADATGANPDAVERLLRFLVSRGLFTRDSDGRYANNGATEILRKDHAYGWRDWVLFFGSDWNAQIWNQMPGRVRRAESATRAAFGEPFFDYVNRKNPDAKSAFNGAMAAGSRLQALLFADAIDFSSTSTLCDVGGGSGSVVVQLLRRHPHLRGTVFDLPDLAAAATALFEAHGVQDRASFRGGDFFAAVPSGSDVYTLFAIIHDWDDERCVRILRNIAVALPPHGRIMVVEKPLPHGNENDVARATDMIMLMLGDGGRERTVEEYEALFASAQLRVQRRFTLPSLFEVFVLVPG